MSTVELTTEAIIIITNILVFAATAALFIVTYADVVKDNNRTLRDIVRLLAQSQRRHGGR